MRKKSGFTLIELLVTMTIVAVLLGLAMVSYQGARRSARDGKRKTDLEEVRSALEMRRTDCGSYPVGNLSSDDSITGDGVNCPAVTYMVIPDDPLPSQAYSYSGAADTYNLCATLETGGSHCVYNP